MILKPIDSLLTKAAKTVKIPEGVGQNVGRILWNCHEIEAGVLYAAKTPPRVILPPLAINPST